jgi:tRNA1Val (adenine37-N6)-methyltransferase
LSVIRPLSLFDLIVSNPPFFSNSLKSPDNKRNTTRHNDETLPFEQLLQNASSILSENGYFSLILPVPEAELFRQKAASYQLFPTEIHHIFSKPQKPESRQILVLKKQLFPQPPAEKSICIYQADSSYSEEYKAITSEFYVNF